MYKDQKNTRLYVVFSIYILSFVSLWFRLGWLQLKQGDSFAQLAKNQQQILLKINPRRGFIFDRNHKVLAMDVMTDSCFASSRNVSVENAEALAKELSPLAGEKETVLRDRLNKDKAFVWLARRLPPDKVDRIKSLNSEVVKWRKEPKRQYPAGNLASHVLGFTGLDNEGLEGLELFYNKDLKGRPGWVPSLRDAKNRELAVIEGQSILTVNGYNLYLTIDEVIQHIAEKELKKAYEQFKAKSATIIVMEPSTGGILALANQPTYDPNIAGKFKPEERRNKAITDFYEPGSAFKIVTASAALEEGVCNLQDVFYCEDGSYTFGRRVLHDHRPHGDLTFKEVIEKSSNIGVAKIAQLVGEKRLYRHIKAFGFGKTSGVDFPGEAKGIIRPPSEWSKISITSIPMGQEVAVTPLQLLNGISLIANNGVLMKPMLVSQIRHEHDELIKSFAPQPIRRAISEETSIIMKDILECVVESGTGRRAKLRDYTVCGKTGTAQKPDSAGGYSHTRFSSTFIGFAPKDKPVISILVMLDEPRPVYYGGVVAAPVFKKVAEQTLRYLKVAPDKGIYAKGD